MNSEAATALRTVVRRIDDAASKFAAGVTLGTLALVLASCQDLRAADLDETGSYFVAVIERSAAMLDQADDHPGRMPSREDRARWEIELLKGVWRLDAHLSTFAAMRETQMSVGAAGR